MPNAWCATPPVDKHRIVPKLFLKPSSAIVGPDAPAKVVAQEQPGRCSLQRRFPKASSDRQPTTAPVSLSKAFNPSSVNMSLPL
jgi:hypothetical protein